MTDENTMTAELGNILLVIVVIVGFVFWYIRNRGELKRQMLRVPLPRGKKEDGNNDKNEKIQEVTDKTKDFLAKRPVTVACFFLNVFFAGWSVFLTIPNIWPDFAAKFMEDSTAIPTIFVLILIPGVVQFSEKLRDVVSVVMFFSWLGLIIARVLL